MTKRRRLIEFFEGYEANFNAAILCVADGVTQCADAFAEVFVAAEPARLACSRNDDSFRQSIEESCLFYRTVGTRAVRLDGIDSTPIDGDHVMARVHWRGEFRRADGSDVEVPFDIVYFVRMNDDVMKIFGYVTGDQQAALRQHGVLN